MSFTAPLITPNLPDPLPRYTRDPETTSIRSAAPSYTSAAPSYRSNQPNHNHNHSHTRRLPRADYAPGFTRRCPNPDIRDLELQNYNITAWSNPHIGPQARHYASVASRRCASARRDKEPLARNNAVAMQKLAMLDPCGPSEELDPLEDPYVVGTAMAEQARKARLGKIAGERGMEILRQEDRKWDFMVKQMADWRERERSWEQFRKGIEAGKAGRLRRRIGLGRR
ncbi:MAG: hypothetical protein M1824_003660 [Vezdaea acicularis]|nr:MAG: hypothetical protein M1824_003660 [Vezdaea acicularis]